MWDLLFYLLLIALFAVLMVVCAAVARAYMTGSSPVASFFAAKAEPRIYVTEQASVDGRRRLLLIRRDDVEHLIMTGGPVDMVIETGIGARSSTAQHYNPALGSTLAFERGPRASGQKASDG